MAVVFPRLRAAAAVAAASFAVAGSVLAAPQVAAVAVTGHAPSRGRAEAYVQHVPPGPRDESVARWRDPICPLVSGLARDEAEALLERLSAVALAVGAPLGSSDCRPNLYIVASPDPKATLRAWTLREPLLFGPGRETELEHLIRTDRPGPKRSGSRRVQALSVALGSGEATM